MQGGCSLSRGVFLDRRDLSRHMLMSCYLGGVNACAKSDWSFFVFSEGPLSVKYFGVRLLFIMFKYDNCFELKKESCEVFRAGPIFYVIS